MLLPIISILIIVSLLALMYVSYLAWNFAKNDPMCSYRLERLCSDVFHSIIIVFTIFVVVLTYANVPN